MLTTHLHHRSFINKCGIKEKQCLKDIMVLKKGTRPGISLETQD